MCSESNKSNIFAPAGAKINSCICLFLTFSYLELGKYLPMGLCEGLPKYIVQLTNGVLCLIDGYFENI